MRDTASRSWRPVGYWMLTFNAGLGFPALLIGSILRPDVEWGVLAGAYATVLAAWATAAGIRQWGKHDGAEK